MKHPGGRQGPDLSVLRIPRHGVPLCRQREWRRQTAKSLPAVSRKQTMLANPSGAPSVSFRILNDGNLGFPNRWLHLKGIQIKLPPWGVSALNLKFVGPSMGGRDETAIPPKMTRGPPRSNSVQWGYDRFVWES
jgi:hypothetical protein